MPLVPPSDRSSLRHHVALAEHTAPLFTDGAAALHETASGSAINEVIATE
ncbi:hypothetical protein [Actinomadura sp. 6N118]